MDFTLLNMNMLYIKYLDGRVHRQCHLPLGPLYLISALRGSGIDVDFRDYQLAEREDLFVPEALADFLGGCAPVVGISCMANLLPFVLYAMPELKRRYPDRKFILGGVGAMEIEGQVLERTPEIDVVHRGEGERSVHLLVRAMLESGPLDDVPGIFYRKDGVVRRNHPAPRIDILDTLPYPDYGGLDFSRYAGHNMLGSRGCPYPCTFCSIAPIWGHTPHSRSSQHIVDEMSHLHRVHGVRQFLFQDEYFISGPERVMEFARILTEAHLDVTYKAFARVDLVDEESLRALGDSGCVEIRFGVESGSDAVLGRIRKGFDSKSALRVVSMAKKLIRGVDAFYIWGFPFESMDDFGESLFQMVTLRGTGVRILPSLLTYLPQTQLYRELEDPSKLEFCPWLLPEYMMAGMEKRVSVRVDIDERYSDFFDYIIRNSDIFPGFFQMDIERNILPKLDMLEEFDFYRREVDESCGAHSPSQTGAMPGDIALLSE